MPETVDTKELRELLEKMPGREWTLQDVGEDEWFIRFNDADAQDSTLMNERTAVGIATLYNAAPRILDELDSLRQQVKAQEEVIGRLQALRHQHDIANGHYYASHREAEGNDERVQLEAEWRARQAAYLEEIWLRILPLPPPQQVVSLTPKEAEHAG